MTDSLITDAEFTELSPSPEAPRHTCSINVRISSPDVDGGYSEDTALIVVTGTSYTNAMDKAVGVLLMKLGAHVKSARA